MILTEVDILGISKQIFKGIYAEKGVEDLYYDTRIVGFRTTKSCRQDPNIKSIQPIYYSLNEGFCKSPSMVKMVSDEMKEEIGWYGLDCNDPTLVEAHIEKELKKQKKLEKDEKIDPEFQQYTEILIWAMIPVLVCMTALACWEYRDDRDTRREAKNQEMK